MYFDRNLYKTAGAYYDSTMTAMVQNSKPFRIIKKKRENLDDVIYYEGIAQSNDSILNLISLSKEEQLAFYSEYTIQLKIRTLEEERLEREALQNRENNIVSQGNSLATDNSRNIGNSRALPGSIGNNGPSSSFYFYNPTNCGLWKK